METYRTQLFVHKPSSCMCARSTIVHKSPVSHVRIMVFARTRATEKIFFFRIFRIKDLFNESRN